MVIDVSIDVNDVIRAQVRSFSADQQALCAK